jgi:putative membrane protein
MMGFGMGLGLLVMLLFWGSLIFLAVWLVKSLFSGNPSNQPTGDPGNNSDAREILAERYARGEINREQYELMKQDIG